MANTYYSISISDAIVQLKTALISKYGAGVTVHFQDTTNLVLSCSAISNKVLKFTYITSRLLAYYGDAWTSGATITNPIQWGGYNSSTTTYINLILGDNTLIISFNQGTTINCGLFLIGKLTNDKYAVLGMFGTSTFAYLTNCLGRNITDTIDFHPVTFSGPFASSSGKLYKQPVILQRSDGKVEINGDGSIASFRDVFNCSHALPNTTDMVGTNFLITPASMYMVNGKMLYTSLLAEY